MTVSLEHLSDVPAVRSMVEQHSIVDPYDEPHAVIDIRVVVSRDHLAAAVEMGVHRLYARGERNLDDLTTEEVRYFAESYVLTESALEMQQAAEGMAQMADPGFYDPEAHQMVLAVYRAVDRAFPKRGGGS